ncbi:MAG: ACT domain-containing protein [Clostridiales bacterium]|nr:ACT domain-containing protein [Clostridiales bacterium]
MVIKQLSVFLQNETGRLLKITDILKKENINISALSIAETEEYGIIRMIVSDIDKAEKVLRENDYKVKVSDVICLITPDIPGALNEKLELLAAENINVSYMYGYSSEGKARLIIKASDPERAAEILNNNN